jgi:hypothetical protein
MHTQFNVRSKWALISPFGAGVQTMNEHLGSLCHDLQMHTITDVQTSERVSLLLKDSFVESFPHRDRPFVKQFAETQMFSVYSDSVIT